MGGTTGQAAAVVMAVRVSRSGRYLGNLRKYMKRLRKYMGNRVPGGSDRSGSCSLAVENSPVVDNAVTRQGPDPVQRREPARLRVPCSAVDPARSGFRSPLRLSPVRVPLTAVTRHCAGPVHFLWRSG
ncbi:hypothetical protein GCM10022284_39640 [Streptomyces hundungensis]